jgi:nicotinamidase-related amidase
MLEVTTRSRAGKNSTETSEIHEKIELNPSAVACIAVDLWNEHWCRSANTRLAPLLPKINQFLQEIRRIGIKIIHAPSETIPFYQETPQRRAILQEPIHPVPKVLKGWRHHRFWKWDALPFAAVDDGCPDHPKCHVRRAWTRQHPIIEIGSDDLISDSGVEIYNFLQNHHIDTILYLGVHLNMCVLGRSFGIRNMTDLGKKCYLIRDLTDIMFKPSPKCNFSHETALDLMIKYVERQFCPSILSEDFHL